VAEFSLTKLGQAEVAKNMGLAYHLMRKYRAPYGHDDEEWLSEIQECLVTAVAYFSPARGTTMGALLDSLVKFRRKNINTTWLSAKRGNVLRTSLDAQHGDGDGDCSLMLMAVDHRDDGQADIERRDLCQMILSRCSGRGEQILGEILKGNSLNEAATIIGISPQFVKQVLTSVRRKMVLEFPDFVNTGPGKCVDCGGPTVQMNSMSSPKRCVQCGHLREKRIKKAYWTIRNKIQNKKRR
jgi:hypothetical protein